MRSLRSRSYQLPFVSLSTRRLSALAVSATAASLLAAGCGSGGGSSPVSTAVTPVDAQTETTQARQQLSSLIAGATTTATPTASNGGTSVGVSTGNVGTGVDPTVFDVATLTAVRDKFAAAYAANSANTQASFGLGVTDLAINARALAVDANAAVNRAQPARRATTAKSSNALVSALIRPLLLGNVRGIASVVSTKSLAALVSLPLVRSRQETTTTTAVSSAPSLDIDGALNTLLTALNRDLPLITAAANDPKFSFPMPGVGGANVTTTLDQADARAFEAGVLGGRAALDAALAYSFDSNGFDFSQPVIQTFPSVAGAPIFPGDYLPAAPWGQLNSNGKTLIAGAKADLIAATAAVGSDISLLQARTGTTTHLIPSTSLTAKDYSDLQLGLAAVQYALNHSFSYGGIKYNPNAWFTNPPTSLTAFAPSYHFVNGAYIASAADYPDKTFGGLVSGLPDSAFTATVDGSGTYTDLALQALAGPLKAIADTLPIPSYPSTTTDPVGVATPTPVNPIGTPIGDPGQPTGPVIPVSTPDTPPTPPAPTAG